MIGPRLIGSRTMDLPTMGPRTLSVVDDDVAEDRDADNGRR